MERNPMKGLMCLSRHYARVHLNFRYSHSILNPSFAEKCKFEEKCSAQMIEISRHGEIRHIPDRTYSGLKIQTGYSHDFAVEPLAGETGDDLDLILGKDWFKQHSLVPDMQQELFYFWPNEGELVTGTFHEDDGRKFFAFTDGTPAAAFFRKHRQNYPPGWLEEIEAREPEYTPSPEWEDPVEMSDDGPSSDEGDWYDEGSDDWVP